MLIECGADVNAGADPPIAVAASKGHANCLRALYNSRADLDRKSAGGCTAVHAAALNGQSQCITLLARLGASVSETDNPPPLMAAANNGHIGCVKVLKSLGADVNQLNKAKTHTALHAAASNNNVAMIGILYYLEADIDIALHDGRTALFLAAGLGHLESTKALITCGADINAADDNHLTPLGSAASHGHAEIVKLLLSKGAATRADDGPTALMSAVAGGDPACIDALLSASVDINAVFMIDSVAVSALDVASTLVRWCS